METIIAMKNIKKCFGDKIALNNVNISVKEGEIFGLLGPSGAGKTTIIKLLIGQLVPSDGMATIFDTNTKCITNEIYNTLGMVLDTSGLYERLSCYDNLLLFSEIYGINKANIKQVLAKVELENEAKKAVSKLSKGMKQRLVLARAIMHSPKLLFLDEPTSGQDPATALKVHKLIYELRDQGSTIFLTTHNMEEAYGICDNIALLNDGRIIEYGIPEEICRKYNAKKNITILLKDGQKMEIANDKSSASIISKCFELDAVESIHSSEPNLESVFLLLTGRKLV